MTSKERAELKARAMKLDSIFQIGKSNLTPQMIDAVRSALKARELIKLTVLKNCMEEPRRLAEVLAERTGSQVVQVIGRKIVLYKINPQKEEKRKRLLQQQKKKKKTALLEKQSREQSKWSRKDSLKKKERAQRKKRS